MNAALEQFAEALQKPEESLELGVAAFLLGGISGDSPLEVSGFQAQLDRFAELAKESPARAEDSPWAAARAVSQALFEQLGFRGNAGDYYNPDNSFLHRVLATRLGLPITLSVLYLEVARRLGIPARGVGFPGHFLVRVESPGSGQLLLDPFHGGVELDSAGLTALLERRNGAGAQVEPSMLEALPKTAILRRMLFNLAGIYGQRNDWNRSLAVLERLAILDPNHPRIERELSALRARIRTLN